MLREWSYGPYERTISLPCPVDAGRANLSYGNGVLTVSFPKAATTAPALLAVTSTGHARGITGGHAGRSGGEPEPGTVA